MADPKSIEVVTAKLIAELGTDAEKVLIEEAKANRNNAGPKEHAFIKQLNSFMEKEFAAH